jgi:catechol 2,3-dioxygenase-like lactoylglutathione lyase family enzyme
MKTETLHHVALVTRDLPRAVEFYRDVLGLKQVARPPFKSQGAWMFGDTLEVHLIAHPGGNFRPNALIDIDDAHFAIRVADFEGAMTKLAAHGFREDAAEGDPKRIRIIRQGVAGFPQAYFLDPDRNIIEINAAR